MPVRLQLVVNPTAGRGRAATLLPGVQRALADHDVVVSPTRSLAHADELTEAAVADGRVVVAMGGDGIVGRVAGTVAERGGVMGIVPGGRGNDFCRMVGIPLDAVDACAALTSAVESKVDLGYAGDHAFVGIASVGFDSEVQERLLKTRLPLGQLVYTYGAVRTALSYHKARFTGTVDNDPLDVTGWSVVVANSALYGGGMRIAPSASVTDGLLEVMTIAHCSRTHFLRVLPKVFGGAHVNDRVVRVVQGARVRLEADRPFRVFADGDPIATLPCEITVRPGALRLLLPVAPAP
jgi:YegS/Rv2252/BmrU family lipid kinase